MGTVREAEELELLNFYFSIYKDLCVVFIRSLPVIRSCARMEYGILRTVSEKPRATTMDDHGHYCQLKPLQPDAPAESTNIQCQPLEQDAPAESTDTTDNTTTTRFRAHVITSYVGHKKGS